MYSFNLIRSGGRALKAPPPRFFVLTHLILKLHYCALGNFLKNSLTQCDEYFFLIWGQDLAAMGGGVSKFKFDMFFIIFREFNMMM